MSVMKFSKSIFPILFELICDVYTNDGYNFPRGVIQKAKSIAKYIPEEERLKDLPEGNPITVYRADMWQDARYAYLVKTCPSWTTNKNVAIWFAYRRHRQALDWGVTPKFPPCAIWKGEIARDKIIAYLTGRDEFEVLQHNNVKNLEVLPAPTEEEINLAFAEHKQHCDETAEMLEKELAEEYQAQDM